jgi:hypothetical protein
MKRALLFAEMIFLVVACTWAFVMSFWNAGKWLFGID